MRTGRNQVGVASAIPSSSPPTSRGLGIGRRGQREECASWGLAQVTDALRRGIRTEAALLLAGGGETRVVPSWVGRCTPTARGGVGALQCVMAELLTVGTLGELVEAEVSLQLKGSGKSGQAGRTGELLGFGAGNSDDDGGGSL